MSHIIIPSKIGISLDVDGTLVDSDRECYKRVCEAWSRQYDQEYPLSYEQFHSFRPLVSSVEDFFTYSKIMIDNECVLPENADEIHAEYLNNPNMMRMTEFFYANRKDIQSRNMVEWVKENPVYEGVPDMFDDLSKTRWNVFVVTSKDRNSVQAILSYHGFDRGIMNIYDKEYGKRPQQFAKASAGMGIDIKNIIPYDDLLKQLQAAKSLGMFAVGAPQGYGINEEIERAGFTLAYPNEFTSTVEEHLRNI